MLGATACCAAFAQPVDPTDAGPRSEASGRGDRRTAVAVPAGPPELVLRIERFRTCEACPAYEIQYFSDGTHLYTGKDAVFALGARGTALYRELDLATFGPDDYRSLQAWGRRHIGSAIAGLAERGFFDLADDYVDPAAPGQATVEIMARRDGTAKTVRFQLGAGSRAPESLSGMTALVEAVLDKEHYLRPVKPFAGDTGALAAYEWQTAGPCGGEHLALVHRDGRLVVYARPYRMLLARTELPVREVRLAPADVDALQRAIAATGVRKSLSNVRTMRTALTFKDGADLVTVLDVPADAPIGRVARDIHARAQPLIDALAPVPAAMARACDRDAIAE
jgi:hypothetical protein